MAERATAVSMRADDILLQSLKALARTKGKTMADLTRDAVDAYLGVELKPFIVFFTDAVNRDGQKSITGGNDAKPGNPLNSNSLTQEGNN